MISFRICGASSPFSGERKLSLRGGWASLSLYSSMQGIRTYSAGVSLGNPANKEGQQEVGRELCQWDPSSGALGQPQADRERVSTAWRL